MHIDKNRKSYKCVNLMIKFILWVSQVYMDLYTKKQNMQKPGKQLMRKTFKKLVKSYAWCHTCF